MTAEVVTFTARCPRCMATRAVQLVMSSTRGNEVIMLDYAYHWLKSIAEREDLRFCAAHSTIKRRRKR